MGMILFILIYIAFLYYFLIGRRKRDEKKRQELYNTLLPGTRISTVSGICCTVVDQSGGDVIVELSADADKPIKARLLKGGISEVLPAEAGGPGPQEKIEMPADYEAEEIIELAEGLGEEAEIEAGEASDAPGGGTGQGA